MQPCTLVRGGRCHMPAYCRRCALCCLLGISALGACTPLQFDLHGQTPPERGVGCAMRQVDHPEIAS